MIRLLRNEIYDKEGENAAYDGPTEFTYGADNNIQAIHQCAISVQHILKADLIKHLFIQRIVIIKSPKLNCLVTYFPNRNRRYHSN